MIFVLKIILLIVLLALAALTAACEISIIGASRIKLKRLAAEGSKSAKAVLAILGAPQKFFGTNFINLCQTLLVFGQIIRTLLLRIGLECVGRPQK